MSIVRRARRAFGPFLAGMGVLHLAVPDRFTKAMPSYLPAHRELVLLSGVVEIAGGLAVLHPRTRSAGRLLAAATMVGVFPANVEMARNPQRLGIPEAARPILLARLPLQIPLVLVALRAGGED